VTQYDIKLVLAIEDYIGGKKLDKIEYDEKEVLDDINSLVKVMQVVKIKMNENGVAEQFDDFKAKKQKRRL
jgi:hypothetical protein